MDKSALNKKKSPAGTTRRAYSIFGGIINLTQQQQQQSHITKSNVLASSPGNVGGGGGGSGGGGAGTATPGTSGKCSSVVGGGTSQDPQGSSSNVYTVTVTNSQTPDNTNQVKTYENLVPMVVVRKKIGDQSTSTVSSLTTQSAAASSSSNSGGMSKNNSNGGGGSGRIGPAPRTLSILTALNELAISDEIEPNPTCSSLTATTTPPSSTSCNNRSNNTVGINNVSGTISKFNPTHSSSHYPGKRSSFGGNILQQHQYHHQYESPSTSIASSTSSASLHHPPHHLHYQYTLPNNAAAATTSVYHSTSTQSSSGGLYATTSTSSAGSNSQGYSEQGQPSYGNISVATPSSSTFPSALGLVRRAGNKSQGSHKESSTRRKGGAVAAVNRQRDRSKSRTPDWIWKIFQLTKHGKLEELQQSLLGLDSTLIRHLADAKGNTVLHCAARGGHVNTLQWLVSVLGSQCTEAALNDHNQAGRTVILTALKKGQLDCLQWLVHQTKSGEKALVPNEGERSLLHYAVCYGNVNVVRWLCSELIDKGICVDIRDAGGMTPLHDAAKSGNVTVCHELILAGADPLSQTELGWRPSDLAIRHRHLECASYFMVAEAAGSLGNQLHSLLFAFNQLRQEHEDLRSHFRETLRVGKWLAKERNDLIKHFPSKWSQDSGTSPSSCALLLGGTNNGGRFSDLEHKLVVAEQAWKKISQSTDDTNEQILNGEEQSFTSNVSSHDFLNRRLAAIQLRHERNQSLGNSMLNSGSSDEDPYAQEQGESSSSSEDDDDDASSSDVDAERITSVVTAGSDGGGMMGQNSSAIIHSSTNVSPSQKKNSSGSSAMRTRSAITTATTTTTKAAPWLLPPNDAFLSQLSPFVGAHVGKKKSLPTLDLLVHGAPTSLLSPIVTLSSPSASSAFMQQQPTATTATATDTAGKNEKSSVQMDIELHHYAHLGSSSNHAAMGKRDSTSLDISVLEVIEPTSSHPTATSHSLATSASSPSKKNVHQAPDLICGTQNCRPLPRNRVDGHHPHRRMSQPQQHHSSQSLSLRESRQRRGYYSQSEENLLMGQQADALYEPISSPPPSFMRGDYHRQRRNMGSKPETIQKYNVSANDSSPPRLGNASLTKSVDTLDTVTSVKGESSREDSRCKGGNEEQLPRPSSSLSVSLSAYKMCAGAGSVGCDSGSATLDHVAAAGKDNFNSSSYASATNGAGSIGNTRRIVSKSRTPSPKSYVTKLTVIPVETTSETCFLTVRSTPFDQQEEQVQSGGTRVAGEDSLHQLHRLPGENSEELSSLGLLSSCHIPNDSVSSSNTPVMPRFNSSGTVVFPSRKPCSSDWHSSSAELLSLTTPDSSLAGRLSPTPSENSRTESAFAPPASYVSHASQNSELSKTESARGQNTENEVSIEEEEGEITNRDLGNISLSLPLVVNVQSSFINHTSANNTHSSFQTIHPSQLTQLASATSSSSSSLPQSFPSQNTKYSSTSSDNMAMMLDKTEKENLVIAQGSFEMGKSDRKKNRDGSSATATKDPYARDDGYDHEATNTAFADDSGNHDGDNDRSAIKQTSLFERKKQQHQQRRIPGSSSSAVNSTSRFIRSHSSSSIHKANAHHRVPKGGQSKPWYEIEGSDDEGSLLRVAKSSRSTSHSSNSSSIPTNNASSSSTGESAGSDSSFPSNPEESSSQNESTEEGNQKEDDDTNGEITSGEQGPNDEEKETKVGQSESELETHQNSSSPSSPTYI